MEPKEVKRIRKRLGRTQAELAQDLGVSRETVARWETGTRPVPGPAARLLERLQREGQMLKRIVQEERGTKRKRRR
jgi:DNA-binding transcriptional regulator YiaG